MSVFRDSLVFFDQVGLFDVVLPFLLVFTLVFGILEKSKIFGTEKAANGTVYPRKNLNAMVAFCTGFFVVASAQLVAFINKFVANTALILVIIIMFMLLVATFYKEQGNEGLDLSKWVPYLVAVVIPAMVLIILDGFGWLDDLFDYVTGNWNSGLVGTIALFIILVVFMFYVTKSPGKETKS